jgi:hypothetical protein
MAQIVTNDPDYFENNAIQGNFNDQSGDSSGLGIYPAAEQNNTYFAYFNAATSTEPEILNKSAVYVNYLIDSNGNLTNPKPGDNALFNLKNTFKQGSTMFITPEDPSQVYSPLIGENSIENIGTVQLILTSETGKTPSSFLDDIKIATKPRYNQTFAPDYTTGQSVFKSSATNTNTLPFLSSSALVNFTGSFSPLYYQSQSNGNLEFKFSISGSPSDTGSLLNMQWDTIDSDWMFINIDSPFESNVQMTAECRLNFSAFIDSNFSGSTSTEDYAWVCAPYEYNLEAKLQLYNEATSTWNDLEIDVNASQFHPTYGTKIFNSPGIGNVYEQTFPTIYQYNPTNTNTANLGPTQIALNLLYSPIINHEFLTVNDTPAQSYANKIRANGYAVAPFYFPGRNYDPADGQPWSQTLGQNRAYWIWQPQTSKYKHQASYFGDQYIYIKSTAFSPKFNDKLRAVIKFNSSYTEFQQTPYDSTDPLTNPRFSYVRPYIQNVLQKPPITLFFDNSTIFSSFLQTSQNYDPTLTIPANGVLPINSLFVSASYWNTGSIPSLSSNTLMWLTASQALSNNILLPTLYYQNFYDDFETLSSLGYSNPILPIDPLPGDYIRFEYDEAKQYRILAIDKSNPSGFAIGVFPPVPANTKLNHFTISRVVDDGNYIIINTNYPASGSITDNLTGFTKPKFITKVLEDEFTTITTELVKSGVLKNQI